MMKSETVRTDAAAEPTRDHEFVFLEAEGSCFADSAGAADEKDANGIIQCTLLPAKDAGWRVRRKLLEGFVQQNGGKVLHWGRE